MKKIIFVFTLCLVASIPLLSCSREKSREELLYDADKYTKETAPDDAYAYQSGLGGWLSPETSYNYDINGDSSDGIISGVDRGGKKHRMYVSASKATSESSGEQVMIYIDLETGEKHYLCPDTLCTHAEGSGCRYLGVTDWIFEPGSENILYVVKQNAVYRVDIENDVFTKAYVPVPSEDEETKDAVDAIVSFLFAKDGKIFFKENYVFRDETEEGEARYTTRKYLKVLNTETGKVDTVFEDYKYTAFLELAAGSRLYYQTVDGNRLFTTDLNFEDQKVVFESKDGLEIGNVQFDENTDELFFTLASGNDEKLDPDRADEVTGKLYRIGADGEVSAVSMPSDKLLTVRLTREYIYYTAYEPIWFGKGTTGYRTCDETGNKIYRVRRDDTSAPELVFDGHKELFFSGFAPVGDYLYLGYMKLMEAGDQRWFRLYHSYFRVGMSENTIKWINLD